MNFYEKTSNSDVLSIDIAGGLTVDITYSDGEPTDADINGLIIEPYEAETRALYVKIGDEFKSLAEVMHGADQAMGEMLLEQQDNEKMARELSSPYLTGRV